MSDAVWIVFFTLIFPALLTRTHVQHGLLAVFLLLFPGLLTDINNYLMVWFFLRSGQSWFNALGQSAKSGQVHPLDIAVVVTLLVYGLYKFLSDRFGEL